MKSTPAAELPSRRSLKVLVVDDDFRRAKALTHILTSGGHLVSRASSGEECLDVIRDRVPDVVLLDAVLPMMSGLQVCRRIRSDPALRHVIVIMLSAQLNDAERQADGIEAGADEYIPWPTTPRGLLARLGLATRHAVGRRVTPAGSALTPRQREVLTLIASGLTSRAIAVRMGVTLRTAETHRAAIMRRLEVHTTAELVRYALEHDLAS